MCKNMKPGEPLTLVTSSITHLVMPLSFVLFFVPKIVKVNRNSPHPETESDMSRPLHIVWAHRWYVLPL